MQRKLPRRKAEHTGTVEFSNNMNFTSKWPFKKITSYSTSKKIVKRGHLSLYWVYPLPVYPLRLSPYLWQEASRVNLLQVSLDF